MTATINSMELKFADFLFADQLMEGDLIKYDGDLYEIQSVESIAEGEILKVVNDYGEEDEIFIRNETQVEWYVNVEEEVE
jgi:hypothetical protein